VERKRQGEELMERHALRQRTLGWEGSFVHAEQRR
jgi:hypothetical protein